MSEPSLPDKVVAIDERLGEASIDHAFGGALALAYYAEPRATIDIDLNVFVKPAAHVAVFEALAQLGVKRPGDDQLVERDGQARWRWGRTPLDLFFSYDPIHEAMHRAVRRVPFGEDRIPILSPEHLVVCKVLFDRPKDWLDAEQVLASTEELNTDEIREWLRRALAEDDPRIGRFDSLARR